MKNQKQYDDTTTVMQRANDYAVKVGDSPHRGAVVCAYRDGFLAGVKEGQRLQRKRQKELRAKGQP